MSRPDTIAPADDRAAGLRRHHGAARRLGYALATFALLVGATAGCAGSLPTADTATTGDTTSTFAPAPTTQPVPPPASPTALTAPLSSSAPAAAAPAPAAPAPRTHADPPPAAASCDADGYYVNSAGSCVHRPVAAAAPPAGATARCVDGTYSFSQHRRGTCSHHGGVSVWL
jgi:Protein of unknown function (DUF3761)